jgi:hypothetical protein
MDERSDTEMIKIDNEAMIVVSQKKVIQLRIERDEARAEVEHIKSEAIMQSEIVQREWLSPIEAAGLRAEVARLREALEYYANQNYNGQGLGDDGVVARAALETKP